MDERERSTIFQYKARESLAGAESEFRDERFNNCANRCYYACFQAAIAALAEHGFSPRSGQWGHDYVQAQFDGQLINRRKRYPTELRGTLTRTYGLRQTADYKETVISAAEASHALRRSQNFVAVIQSRTQGGGETTS